MVLSSLFVSSKQKEDTLCPDLRQPLYLTGAAGQRLGHHKEQVGAFDALCVEKPVGDSVGG